MKSPVKSKITSKSKTKILDRIFEEKVWKQAVKAVADYQIIIKKGGRYGYIGSSLEMPTVYAEDSTPAKCYAATQEALKVTAATMLECNSKPPPAFSPKKRSVQVNIRLNNEEKLQLTQASQKLGFKGLSDFIRNCALERIHLSHG